VTPLVVVLEHPRLGAKRLRVESVDDVHASKLLALTDDASKLRLTAMARRAGWSIAEQGPAPPEPAGRCRVGEGD
jgi:hypothetical protein